MAAVIPVKPLDAALGRLAGALEAPERRQLQQDMLVAVLAACASSRVDEILVVTGDDAVAGAARSKGARVVSDYAPPRGMNPAVARGCLIAQDLGADAALVLTADLPLAQASDIDTVVAYARPEPSAVLTPSRDGTGTNAMLLCGPRALAPALGIGSLARHEEQARRLGVHVVRCERPRLALDIDTPDDLAALWVDAPCWARAFGHVDTEQVAAGSAG